MKINKKILSSKWFTYKAKGVNVEVHLRPFPFSNIKLSTEESGAMEHLWSQFDYCVIDWKGIDGEDDKPLECTEENKLLVFDYIADIREFVWDKVAVLAKDIAKELKN